MKNAGGGGGGGEEKDWAFSGWGLLLLRGVYVEKAGDGGGWLLSVEHFPGEGERLKEVAGSLCFLAVCGSHPAVNRRKGKRLS